MPRYKNRGVGGALGIIGVALFANHIGLIALIILLCIIPWWVYVVAGVIVATAVLVDLFTKQGEKDENSN